MKNTKSYQSYVKSPYKSVKHTTYFDSYDHFFAGFRDKEITFVEIGVLGGGSLFMWRDYFGPKARIIGVDLNPDAKKWEEHGFEIFIGSQSDEYFWDNFKSQIGGIDLVLDDGGHSYEQQIITAECLLEAIKDGGLLVVEDTHTSYMKGFGPQEYSFIEYAKKKIDDINRRYSKFSGDGCERRFWSIEFVESMVAFKVNHSASALNSEPTSNNGKDDQAEDFRHRDASISKELTVFFEKFNIPTNNKLIKKIIRKLEKILSKRRFSGKKYFDG